MRCHVKLILPSTQGRCGSLTFQMRLGMTNSCLSAGVPPAPCLTLHATTCSCTRTKHTQQLEPCWWVFQILKKCIIWCLSPNLHLKYFSSMIHDEASKNQTTKQQILHLSNPTCHEGRGFNVYSSVCVYLRTWMMSLFGEGLKADCTLLNYLLIFKET